jgi:acyl-CoA thioester hydrolase
MGEPFTHQLRVRYVECDAQGVVFNSNYLAYFDVSMTELWRAGLGSYQAMVERGVDIVVAEAQVRFFSPARFDDLLALEVGIGQMGNTSIVTGHRVRRDDELLVEATMRHVTVELETMGKTPIPEWLRAGLSPWSE